MIIGIPPVPAAVARARLLHGDCLLLREASRALGTSVSTVRRLAAVDPVRLGPARHIRWGSLSISLFDLETIGRLHAHLAAHRTARGRPRLWGDDELRRRRTEYSAVGYRRRRALELAQRGDTDGAARMLVDAALRHRLLEEERLVRQVSTRTARRHIE
jgi:hypothetical protein